MGPTTENFELLAASHELALMGAFVLGLGREGGRVRMGLNESYKHMRKIRPLVCPNDGKFFLVIKNRFPLTTVYLLHFNKVR